MKTRKVNNRGVIHWTMIAPIAVIIIVAAIGIRTFKDSHAATPDRVNIGNSISKVNPSEPSISLTNLATQASNQQATGGILPPQNPSESLSPSPNFNGDGSCPYYVYTNTTTCNTDAENAIDNARNVLESLSGMSFNMSAYEALTAPEQIFVVTNLERSDRGLVPVYGLTNQLNQVAQSAASASTFSDPILSGWTLTGGTQVTSWGSIAAEGTNNPLGSDYYWMYDDGPGGINGDCTTSDSSGCWGHRDVILGTFNTTSCGTDSDQYMGTGYTPGDSSTYSRYTAIVVGACGSMPTDIVFTWQQALQLLNPTVTTPSAPQTVTATTAVKKGITLSWQAPTSNGGAAVTSYKVYRSLKPGKEKLIKTINCSNASCTFNNVSTSPGKTYYYVIGAINSAGQGPLSVEVWAVAK